MSGSVCGGEERGGGEGRGEHGEVSTVRGGGRARADEEGATCKQAVRRTDRQTYEHLQRIMIGQFIDGVLAVNYSVSQVDKSGVNKRWK